MQLIAPAKLNLFLHITGRRENGYHDLETVFQLLDYGDELTFSLNDSTPEIELLSNISDLPEEENLIVKAAKKLQSISKSTQGAKITLNKRLPMGGGIGGGSSDAATTLLALNSLWQLELTIEELADIGLALGADIPVFVRGNTAFAKGIGEDLTPLNLPEHWFLVVTPDAHVSTQKIFTHPQLTRDSSAIKIPPLVVEGGRNDCQTVVEQLYPEVAKTRRWMEQYAPAFMTGTGASLFSIFKTESEAQSVRERVPEDLKSFVARGVNQSPTHATLQREFS